MYALVLLAASFTLNDVATASQVESLERGLAELEEELASEDDPSPEVIERSEALRDEVVYLRVKSRKHRESGREGTGLDALEVTELRQSIARLRDDLRLASVAGERAELETMSELPPGTLFAARLLDSLSSETAEVGDAFEAVTVLPVAVQGDVLIPAGASVFGAIELVERAGRTDRKSRLVLAVHRLDVEGRTQAITATVVGASEDLETGWGDEKKKMGIGAGVGGVLGAVIGGGTGAVAGAILGGSGVVFGTDGKDVVLPRGTMLQLRLDRTVLLPVR